MSEALLHRLPEYLCQIFTWWTAKEDLLNFKIYIEVPRMPTLEEQLKIVKLHSPIWKLEWMVKEQIPAQTLDSDFH